MNTQKNTSIYNAIWSLLICAMAGAGISHGANIDVDFVNAEGRKFVIRNNNDSDNNGEWDLEQEGLYNDSEDADLIEFKVTTSIQNGIIQLSYIGSENKIKVWASKEKVVHSKQWLVQNGKIKGSTNAPSNSDETEGYFYVEGIEISQSWNDVKIKVEVQGTEERDEIRFSVLEVDLDIDSNNNEGLSFESGSEQEDKMESIAPGKIVMVNDGFGDDIPDWADGFDSSSHTTQDEICGPPIRFVPIILTKKAPFTSGSHVTFHYSASDPSAVGVIPGGFPGFGWQYHKPMIGKIRIWKKNNGSVTRDKRSILVGGDYIPDGVSIPWAQISSGEVATLWIEAVSPSDNMGDINVRVEMSEGSALAADEIALSAVKIVCEPICKTPSQDSFYPINPSGFIEDSWATYEIKVSPQDFPNNKISWTSNYETGAFFPEDAKGRVVMYNGGEGLHTLTINIDGNYYPPRNFGALDILM